MWTKIAIISTLFLTQLTYLLGQTSKLSMPCKTEIDSLTKQLVYLTADREPQNEGGNSALIKRIEKNIINDISDTENYDLKVIVAFIIDTDGSIKGCRVIKDKTNKVGLQMLDIIKSFKWTPAKCGNENVAMICKMPLILDPTEQ